MSLPVSVVRSAPTIVRPCSQTPLETLDLSANDKFPGRRSNIRLLQVFENGGAREAAARAPEVIKSALSRALVHYYPIAGRLKEAEGGDFQVACTGEGVLFMKASAGCSLEAVSYLDQFPIMACPPDDLLPVPAGSEGEADYAEFLLRMQVTEFECGGFVIGLELSHTICDGLGAAKFVTAVAELARGAAAPTIKPVWHREAIPSPPPGPHPWATAVLPSNGLREAMFDATPRRIEELKRECSGLTGRRCTTFEVLVATVWQCRARSILSGSAGGGGGDNLELLIFASVRHHLVSQLPEGFYGNCVHPVTTTATAAALARASLRDVVALVRGAKERLAGDFAQWAAGTCDRARPPLSYATMVVTDWSKLGLDGVDYGWGPPKHLVPLQPASPGARGAGTGVVPVCVLSRRPRPEEGTRLITCCVGENHLASFRENVSSSLL